MTIKDAMRTYRLPNPTTPEDLETRWSKVLTFGDKILLAGHFYNGKGKRCFDNKGKPVEENLSQVHPSK